MPSKLVFRQKSKTTKKEKKKSHRTYVADCGIILFRQQNKMMSVGLRLWIAEYCTYPSLLALRDTWFAGNVHVGRACFLFFESRWNEEKRDQDSKRRQAEEDAKRVEEAERSSKLDAFSREAERRRARVEEKQLAMKTEGQLASARLKRGEFR